MGSRLFTNAAAIEAEILYRLWKNVLTQDIWHEVPVPRRNASQVLVQAMSFSLISTD